MSNNSYFGFTTPANQYGTGTGYSTAANTAASYGTPAATQQQAYGTTAQMTAQRQYQTYDTSQYQQYAAATQAAAAQAQTQRYDASKAAQQSYYGQTGYTQHQATDATAHAAAYQQSMAKPAYQTQTASSTYSALRTVTPATNTQQAPTPKSYSVYSSQGASSYSTYNQQSQHSNNKPVANASGNTPSWTAALYAAAANMHSTGGGNNAGGRKPGLGMKPRPKMPPKPQQLHYCEVCKISCAGPQTYKEHLEGQKHKKKEAAAKNGGAAPETGKGRPVVHGTSLRCELCDVTCTGADAYAAHIRGAKHQKVVKLHTKLGKPIPSTDPVVLASSKIVKKDGEDAKEGEVGEKKVTLADIVEQDVQPVGQEYIEELRNNEGKVISFQCKLCDCKFSDPNAKEMHMKGRRHRLQYKKKVNPELVVDIKPSMRRGPNGRLWKGRDDESGEWDRGFQGPPDMMMMPPWRGPGGPRGPPPPHPMMLAMMGPPFRRPDTPDDRHILAKHSKIYPPEEELAKIQRLVSHTEKALKGVSDALAEAEIPKEKKEEEETKDTEKKESEKKDDDGPQRSLRGVMRVGMLAKGLLLTGDTEVGLVVLSGDKPTKSLLNKVAKLLPAHLEAACKEVKYDVKQIPNEACILVSTVEEEPQLTVKVTLTSPVMRDTPLPKVEPLVEGAEKKPEEKKAEKPLVKDPIDVLNKDKCLDALAALRHAKWFQARASSLQSCVMLVRIFRDLCQRVPTWNNFKMWPLELVIEKVIASAEMCLHPGDALRRVLEAISFGLILPGGPGLMDPCEKEPTDALASLTSQDREDITASAQHALRLMSFRQIHKVLGMEALPPPKFRPNNWNRKRRLDNTSESGEDGGKKDKKEGEEAKKTEEKVA